MARRARRPESAARADAQPGAHQLHAHASLVGPDARARDLGARAARAVAEGLRSAAPERRVRDRHGRRLGDTAARRRATSLVGRDGRRHGPSQGRAARRLRVTRCLRARLRRRRGGNGPRRGHTDRGGRGRSGRRRGGHGHHALWRRQRHDRHVRRRLRRNRASRARSEGPHSHVLPRRAGPMARHGRHAGGRAVVAMDARPDRRDRWTCGSNGRRRIRTPCR